MTQRRYRVVRRATFEELEREVGLLLAAGWEPTGGIFASGTDVAQAMVRPVVKIVREPRQGVRA